MRLVVKLTDEEYELCRRLDYSGVVSTAIRKILNGKRLPKGCGRLIDADELEERKEIMNTISGESKYAVRMDDVRSMPTIIEADKEGEEE